MPDQLIQATKATTYSYIFPSPDAVMNSTRHTPEFSQCQCNHTILYNSALWPSSLSSQKVLTPSLPTSGHSAPVIWYSTENLEVWCEILAHRHYRSDVAAPVAVIRSRPNGYDILGREVVFIAFVDKLVSSSYQLEVVYVVELEGGVSKNGDETSQQSQLTSLDTLSPNNHPAPRGLTAQVSTSSGSLHTRSQNAPS